MSQHFVHEIERLKKRVLALGALVEESVHRAVRSVQDRDGRLATQVIKSDAEIDRAEVELEEECLKVLALHQPVAQDLRFVVAVLKINNDLERIGDIVVKIADRGIRLTAFPVTAMQGTIMRMGKIAREMLGECLDAFIALDLRKSIALIARDDEMDRLNLEVINQVITEAKDEKGGAMIESLILTQSVARDLERIGDHATNIAEDVAYLVDGTIIRHQQLQG